MNWLLVADVLTTQVG